ncbi:MAG: cytochrome C, partial [Deltaproteobacteria bacterium]|nr:cytochrome C [Deltaproteobacteria bacterium]
MKRYLIVFTAFFVVTMGFASLSYAVISGSAHDFSTFGWSNNEICLPCHTPHNANTLPDAPLWNHELTTASYTLYTSSTLDATMGQPDGRSKLCLSCHDGTVAIDSFGGVTGGTTITGDANLGTDLRDDHPVSFEWGTPHPILGAPCLKCHFGAVDPLPFFDNGSGNNNRLECATCHDVHNSY